MDHARNAIRCPRIQGADIPATTNGISNLMAHTSKEAEHTRESVIFECIFPVQCITALAQKPHVHHLDHAEAPPCLIRKSVAIVEKPLLFTTPTTVACRSPHVAATTWCVRLAIELCLAILARKQQL
ncbi:alkaline phosphatase family protein [Sesbania bispinosa]|nr:alkaline phosphatase family protein [Sesbania bispinosa]